MALTSLINDLSRKSLTPSFPPHITLLSSIPSSAPLSEVLSKVSTAISTFRASHPSSSLQLPLSAPGTRGSYFQYVFSAVEPTPELLALRKATSAAFFPELEGKGDDYFPHLSLVYGQDRGERSATGIILDLVMGGEAKCVPLEAEGEEQREKWTFRDVDEVDVTEIKVVKCDGLPEEWKVLGSVPL
ncbi:hypothetical protein JCM11251_003294 [Rhodosporidiobolus azoricus]